MIGSLKKMLGKIKSLFLSGPETPATEPEPTSTPTIPLDETASVSASTPESLIGSTWVVTTHTEPTFEKVGRVYMDNGDLIIRSDLDSRGFFLGDEDLDLALTGGVGSVRLLETAGVIGTARLSTSGRALNMLIDQQLHTVPLRSLTPVITGCNRKGPLFVPVEDLAPDM
jgi:hypothetical protein